MMNSLAVQFAKIQESSMFDLCLINNYSETYDSYRDLTKAFTSGSTSASSICGVRINSGNKEYTEDEIQQTNDIIVRLPLNTSIDTQDTITITRKNNATISETYSILNIDKGVGELVVKCQKLVS